jgi:NADP-dependent 3-hydroxy acid dehydrogenase YdfG
MAVAVVAGGSAGLGRAVVRELADDGWDVAVLARGEERLAATVDEVRSRGRRAMWIAADVADGDAVEEAAARIEAWEVLHRAAAVAAGVAAVTLASALAAVRRRR